MGGSDSDDLRSDGETTRTEAIATLIERIGAHDAEGASIHNEMLRLKLDTKTLKQIRATQHTLNTLMGIDPATAERVSK
jgi:hypothetical protein